MSSAPFLLLALLSLLCASLVSSQVSSGYCFSYTFTGGSSAATQWTVTSSGLLATSASLSTTLRNSATITGITGTRTFSNASFTSTVSFTSVTSGTNASNLVFSSFPYTDTTGWSITTSGPVYYQNAVGSNTITLWQSYDPLLEVSGSQEIYVGQLKVVNAATVGSVSQCPTNVTLPVYSLQPYSFCLYIQSDGSDSISAAGYPWTTYAYGVFTASQPFEQEGRQAVQLNSITGIRYFTINGSTWWNRLTGIKDDISDLSQWGIKNDNIQYTTSPFLDQYGWLVTADNNLTYPSGTSQSPDINYEYDQYATLQYIDLNADGNYVQSSNQGYAFSPYQANGGGAHAVCNKQNNAAVAFTPSTTQFTFCYSFYGADSTNGNWQIVSSGIITTYAQPVNTTNPNDAFPAIRLGYVVIGISGTRTWSNSSLTSTRNILGVVPDTEVFDANYPFNNVIYTQYPYVDAGGLSFYLDGPVLPQLVDSYGQVLNNVTFVNIHANGINPLKELPTGGEAGALIIRPAGTAASLPAQCASLVAGTNTQYSFCYYLTGDKSGNDPAPQATWTVSAWGVITVSGPFEREGVANTYRVTGIQGQRSVTVTSSAGVTSAVTQNIAGIKTANADINTYSFATNDYFFPSGIPAIGAIPDGSSILVDLYGWLLTLDSNVVYPANNGTVSSVGPDLDFATDQFGTNQYQDVSIYDSTPIFLQSAKSGMYAQPYSGGAVSFQCPNTPASYTPNQSGGGGSGLSGGAIAGIVVGSVVGGILLILIAAALLLGACRSGKSGSKQLHSGSTDASSESSQVQNSQLELQHRTDTVDV